MEPGLEFPNIEKAGRGTVSTRLVFLGQEKLIGALSGASEEFLAPLKYGKSICISRGSEVENPYLYYLWLRLVPLDIT